MKKLLFLFMVLFLSSVSYAAEFKTYVVEEKNADINKMLTFIIKEKNGRQDISKLILQKDKKRVYNVQLERDNEELDRCIKKITKNWKRDITPEGTSGKKTIKGFDEELDHRFKEKLWFKIRKGEKVC